MPEQLAIEQWQDRFIAPDRLNLGQYIGIGQQGAARTVKGREIRYQCIEMAVELRSQFVEIIDAAE